MTPNYEAAATCALETLIKYRIASAPVSPLPILKSMPRVLVVSFAEMAQNTGKDRETILSVLGENRDAATAVKEINGEIRHLVAYNQRLPFYMIQRALARELGHIVLGHNGTLPEKTRMAEAYCFAHHLLCPRPLVYALRQSGIRLTVEVVGSATGCFERCLAGMRKEPGVYIPPELNRLVRDQFGDYIRDFIDFQQFLEPDDESATADFGRYMEGYEE